MTVFDFTPLETVTGCAARHNEFLYMRLENEHTGISLKKKNQKNKTQYFIRSFFYINIKIPHFLNNICILESKHRPWDKICMLFFYVFPYKTIYY